MPAIQTYTYKIRSYHTDESGRLFVHQLLNFLQDAAHNHADSAGYGYQQLIEQNLFWVLSRLSIEILSMPKRGDEVHLSTWVKSIRGAISEREFSISDGKKTLINVSSLWFCVSAKLHKPTRLPGEFSKHMVINESYATTRGTEKVAGADTENNKTDGADITVSYSDIDMIDHVNNAAYARWVMDEVLVDFQKKYSLKKLNINYLGESFLGDKIKVYHTLLNQYTFIHDVVNKESQKVICRFYSIWE